MSVSESESVCTMDQVIDTRMELFRKYLDKSRMEHKQYQYDGIRWCLLNELRLDPLYGVRGGLIADEMGLGKTILMIGLMYSNFVPRTLIIVPPILIEQWFIQIYKTTGHKALIYHGANKKTIGLNELVMARIVISTYGAITPAKKANSEKDSKKRVLSLLHKVSWNRIVFDEAHHLRNSKTTRYIGARLLTSNIKWLVSGTPIQNRKQDFYSLCALIRLPASFYTVTESVRLLASSFILKRTKKQVGIEISDICVEKSVVDWSSEKERDSAEALHSGLKWCKGLNASVDPSVNASLSNLDVGDGKKAMLLQILRAKQMCIYPKLVFKGQGQGPDVGNCSSKLDAVVNSILEKKGNGSGKLVFCHFREEIDEIANRLRNGGIDRVATFDGRTSSAKRHEILCEKNEVLILQIQTGCEGLNLQENYSEIYFVAPHWNPAIEDQAIARCHRIGQSKTVYVYRFLMSSFVSDDEDDVTKTLDNHVCDVQKGKRRICSEFIGEAS